MGKAEDEDKRAADWLRVYDWELWEERPYTHIARERCKRECGIERLSAKRFAALRRECCDYWGKLRHIKPTKGVNLSPKQWHRLRDDLLEHKHLVSGKSLRMAVAILRGEGVIVNETTLAGSETWKAICRDVGNQTDGENDER